MSHHETTRVDDVHEHPDDDLLNRGSGELRPRDSSDAEDRDLLHGGSGEAGDAMPVGEGMADDDRQVIEPGDDQAEPLTNRPIE